MAKQPPVTTDFDYAATLRPRVLPDSPWELYAYIHSKQGVRKKNLAHTGLFYFCLNKESSDPGDREILTHVMTKTDKMWPSADPGILFGTNMPY